MQSMAQQTGGSCVEVGHYGMDEELKRLKRDRSLLMAEVMKLKQQQLYSREQIMAMEERIRSTERKQQQMLSFLAKAFRSPMFVQQYIERYTNEKKHVKIGQKRRIAMSPSVESLQEVVNVSTGSSQPLDCTRDEQLKVESLFSAALDDELSSDLMDLSAEVMPLASETGLNNTSNIWEEFLSDDLIVGDEVEEVLEGDRLSDVEVEELVAKAPEWGEDLQDLVDQLGFL